MKNTNKDTHLQIRVSPEEKAMIARAASDAGVSMSAWLLSRALPSQATAFRRLVSALREEAHDRYALAALNDLLTDLSPGMFTRIMGEDPTAALSPFARNYLAAMVELAASHKGLAPPLWTLQVQPLDEPYFGTDLKSLRLYLLTHSPPPFRRRNIFIDATLGDRV
jgi:uncharacterized protein (DUF1778 family)